MDNSSLNVTEYYGIAIIDELMLELHNEGESDCCRAKHLIATRKVNQSR